MPMLTTLRMRLAGMAFPRTVADALGEVGHPVEHIVYRGHHILAVHHYRRTFRRTQRHVQHGPPLRDVDLLPPEHRIDPGAQVDCLRQVEQKLDRF